MEHTHIPDGSGPFYLVRVRYGNRSWNERDVTETHGQQVYICKECGVVYVRREDGK